MKARNRIRNPHLLLLLLLLVFAACDSQDPPPAEDIRHGVNFARLFAEPTSNEISAVRTEWAGRESNVRDAEIVDSQGAAGATFHIVSHTMTNARTSEDFTHYGLVRIPDNIATIDEDVLLVHHGGDSGLDVETAIGLAQENAFPDLFANTIQVFPSYRSEEIRAAAIGLGNYPSGGNQSPWDYDVDDATALYGAVRELFPTETSDLVASLGLSRGADVAMLQAIRDDRILGVTEYFGPSDFFSLTTRVLADSLLAGNQAVLQLPGVEYLYNEVLLPLQGENGEYDPSRDYEGARLELIKRSPVYFTSDLPALQVHHHQADSTVFAEHAAHLETAIGATPNEGAFDYNYYTHELNGTPPHSLEAMPQSLEATQTFLNSVYEGQPALVAAE